MVEVKAIADNVRNGTSVQVKYDGTGFDVIQETVALIRGLMGDLRKNAPSLHAAIITEIALDSSIILGEDEDEDEEE